MTDIQSVLIVDDDPIQCEILKAYFYSLNVNEVIELNSAVEAVGLIRAARKIKIDECQHRRH